jgi:hypothetical protein
VGAHDGGSEYGIRVEVAAGKPGRDR